MEVLDLLDALKETIIESKKVPLSSKIMVNEDEVINIIEEIEKTLPNEIKQAKWITEERQRICKEAEKEADDIVKEAEKRIIEMIDEHEITRQAEEKGLKIIEDAKIQSREISEGTRDYADSKLAEAEMAINELLGSLQAQEDYLIHSIEKLKEDRRGLNR